MKIERLNSRMVRVTYEWHTDHGLCFDCGAPAAYWLDGQRAKCDKVCSVCAADHAATGGATLERIKTTEG